MSKGIRESTLLDPGDIDAPPGSQPWALHMRMELQFDIKSQRTGSDHLRSMLDLFREHNGFSVLLDDIGEPFTTFEAFCFADPPYGLGYHVDDIDVIIEERKSVEARAAGAVPLLESRRPTNEERDNKVDNIKVNRGGTSADYLTRRIARDHPEILERMKSGEFKSVRAAAKEAGIVRDATPLEILLRTWKRTSAADKATFLTTVTADQ